MFAICLVIVGCASKPGKRELAKGRKALGSGDWVIAKTWFENAINETTGTELKAEAYNLLGVANWRLEDLQAAVRAFESAREIDPELSEVIYNLALVAREKGEEEKALSRMEEAGMVAKDDPRALEYLGAMYLERKRWADARRAYLEALEIARKSARLLTAIGLAEFKLERYAEARNYWEKALKREKDYKPAVYNLAVMDIQFTEGEEQGLKLAKRFLELEPSGEQANIIRDLIAMENAKSESESGPSAQTGEESDSEGSRDLLQMAKRKRQEGLSGHALNLCLQEAIKARRQGDKTRQLEALRTATRICFDQVRAHYALGRFHMEEGEFEKALHSFRQAVAIKPEWTRSRIALAKCSIEVANYDTALVALKKVLQNDKQNAEALWTLARLYDEEMGNNSGAVKQYERFSQLHPGDPRVLKARDRLKALRKKNERERDGSDNAGAEQSDASERGQSEVRDRNAAVKAFNKGVRFQSGKDWSKAIQEYRKATDHDTSFVRAHFNLGVVYGIVGRDKAAKKEYLKTLEYSPDYLNARFNLALIYYNHKEYAKATEQLQKLLGRDGSHAKANFLLGLINAKHKQDIAAAKKHYRRYLQLAPRDRNADKVRAWLNTH